MVNFAWVTPRGLVEDLMENPPAVYKYGYSELMKVMAEVRALLVAEERRRDPSLVLDDGFPPPESEQDESELGTDSDVYSCHDSLEEDADRDSSGGYFDEEVEEAVMEEEEEEEEDGLCESTDLNDDGSEADEVSAAAKVLGDDGSVGSVESSRTDSDYYSVGGPVSGEADDLADVDDDADSECYSDWTSYVELF
jgi:hypothetical protein